jgi:hypothetical protein
LSWLNKQRILAQILTVVRHFGATSKTYYLLKRSLRYFFIALLNLTALTILLALWTDRLELLINDGVRPFEFLKIIVFTIAALAVMRIAVFFFRKRTIVDVKTKMKIATILTLLTSSYLYIDYSGKLLNNRIINRQVREQAAGKLKSADGNGITANNLTIQEYQQVSKFPKVPNQSTNINYAFEYDGFLPDYYLKVIYNIPKEVKADTLYFQQGEFTRSQTVDTLGDTLKVTYIESQQ